MRFATLSLFFMSFLPTAGLAQSVQLSSFFGIAIASPDTTAGVETECAIGTQPVILALGFKAGSLRVRSPRLFDNRDVPLVRLRKGTNVRDVALGRRDPSQVEHIKAFEGSTIKGCLSEGGFSYRTGNIALNAPVKDYHLKINETFEALIETPDFGLTLTYRTEILRAGPVPNAFPNSRRNFWKQDETTKGLPYLGELSLRTSPFPWTFAPLSGNADPIRTTLQMTLNFVVLDGGLNPS